MDRGLDQRWPPNFQVMQDEEIVAYAKRGSELATEHLLAKYRSLVEGKAKAYFVVGADREDVIQEGMIGLFKAIRDFRADKLARFRAFAELCITRQIITAVKTATRQKHIPLNKSLSLHASGIGEDSEGALIDVLPASSTIDPERAALGLQLQEYLSSSKSKLSPLEAEVLLFYLQGLSYREMAERLSCGTKSVDNALQRAKRKIGVKVAQD
jgi:RNA polymerase sporulation-specific sigma factor